MDFRVSLQPALVLLVRVEIIEDDVQLAIREGGDKAARRSAACSMPFSWQRMSNIPVGVKWKWTFGGAILD